MNMEKMNIAKYKSFLGACLLAAPLCTSCYDVEDITALYEPYRANVEEVYLTTANSDNIALVNATFRNVEKVDHFDLYYGIVKGEEAPLDTLQATRLTLTPTTRKGIVQETFMKQISNLDLGATYAFQINMTDKIGQTVLSQPVYQVVPKAQFELPWFTYTGYVESDKVDTHLNFRFKNTVSGYGTIGVQLADTEQDLKDGVNVVTFSTSCHNVQDVRVLPAEGLQPQHTYCARVFVTLAEKTYYSRTTFLTTR